MTLTFDLGAWQWYAKHCLVEVFTCSKGHLNPIRHVNVIDRKRPGRTDGRNDGRTIKKLYAPKLRYGGHKKHQYISRYLS